ncbi:heavy metal-binding domain-containing protein [Dermatophilaceae bacterium Soc4.6]
MGGMDVDDSQDINEIVNSFQRHEAQEHERKAHEDAVRKFADQNKQRALAEMLVTSGFDFQGYLITQYLGYISGDDAVQVDRGTSGIFARATDTGASLMSSLGVIRKGALAELKEAAYELGCNAVIGVDFDYLTLDPMTATSGGGTMYLPYVFGVTANGTAVIVEKRDLAV